MTEETWPAEPAAQSSSPAKRIVQVPELEDATEYGYSQCVQVGSLLFVAGQCGLGTDHDIVSPEFEPQARAALERVRHAVESAGGELTDVVSMTVFITDIRLGRVFTTLRRELFGRDYPASALVGVTSLMVPGALVEVQATAVLGSSRLQSS
jgi:2-iminobutanoate/2-iminopropanoate deaminase